MKSVLAAIAVAVLAIAATAQTQSPDTNGALHVKQVQAMDTTGFGRPLTAFSMLVPTHWKTQGGIVWAPNNRCNRSGYFFAFGAGNEAETEGVAILPQITWTTQPGTACPQLQVGGARDLLTIYAQQLAEGAQVVDYRPRPDLMKDLQALAYRNDYGGMVSEQAVDAGEVLIAYQENGRDMRGTLSAAVIMWRIATPAQYGFAGQDIRGGVSLPAFGAFAEAGRLDLHVAETIRKSIVPGPEWSQEIARHHAVMNRQNQQHANRMSQITSQANSEISDIIHKGYQTRSAIQDRGHRETIEAIRGVETYNDPVNGGTVQLDNTYDHAFQLDDGSFVLTNDNFYQPFNGHRLSVTE